MAVRLHLLVILEARVAGFQLIFAEVFFHEGLVLGKFSIGHERESVTINKEAL